MAFRLFSIKLADLGPGVKARDDAWQEGRYHGGSPNRAASFLSAQPRSFARSGSSVSQLLLRGTPGRMQMTTLNTTIIQRSRW